MNVVLSGPETRQLLAATPPGHPFALRNRALVVFALHTGLRVSELSGLQVHHVALGNQVRQTLHLPAELGKGGSARPIPLNETAQKCVRVLLSFNAERGFSTAPGAPLFQNRFHRQLSVRDMQRLVKALRESAGLDVPATLSRSATPLAPSSWRPPTTCASPRPRSATSAWAPPKPGAHGQVPGRSGLSPVRAGRGLNPGLCRPT